MSEWLAVVFVFGVALIVGVSMICLHRREQRELATLLCEIKTRPRPILWITEDGVIHTTCADATVTADYLDACAAAVRNGGAVIGEGEPS